MEGFGMVFLEAAATGKASIAGDAGGSGEAVLNGVTGFVVNGKDIDTLTATLRRALEDDSLRNRMGQAARERVAREFDWPIVLKRLHHVVLEALGEGAAL
jgi:phosphatidylinositol alpha-1,6-mannosyltransferase